MNCPKCNSHMEKVTYENIAIDRCMKCKGIWFDMLEAEKMKDIRYSELLDFGDAYEGEKYNKIDKISCPVCHTPMIRMADKNQSHIGYESCTLCYGMFFDAGEFRDYKEHSVLDFFKGLFTKTRK